MALIIPRDLIQHLVWVPGQPSPVLPVPPTPIPPAVGGAFSIDDLVNRGTPFYSEQKDATGSYYVGVPISLQQAVAHAGADGIVASLPYLVAGKAVADKSNYLWQTWLTALTEEDVGIDKKGTFVSKGKPVLVVLHGGGILTHTRITQAYTEGLTPQHAAKFTETEFDNLLKGIIPGGESISLYTLEDAQNKRIPHPFGRYGVVMDFETAKATASGLHPKSNFMSNPLVLARLGTLDHAEPYFDKAKNSDDKVGSYHLFGSIDHRQAQGRVLFLYNNYDGLGGDFDLGNLGRFVGVSAGGAT